MRETIPVSSGDPDGCDTDERRHAARDVALPFDDEADRPIAFALTARARREVAPDQLPDLRVVPADDGDLDRADDARRARARALRRSGLPPDAIAGQLGVDELVVRAWVADTAPTRAHRGPLSATRPRRLERENRTEQHAASTDAAEAADGLLRAAVRDQARQRLRTDALFAGTVGFVTGVATVDRGSLSCVTERPETAMKLLSCLRRELSLPAENLRIVLRIGPRVAGDLARHRWARDLRIPIERVAHTRWSAADAPEAVQAMLRIVDGDVAATVAGWSDAFLDPAPETLDVAF